MFLHLIWRAWCSVQKRGACWELSFLYVKYCSFETERWGLRIEVKSKVLSSTFKAVRGTSSGERSKVKLENWKFEVESRNVKDWSSKFKVARLLEYKPKLLSELKLFCWLQCNSWQTDLSVNFGSPTRTPRSQKLAWPLRGQPYCRTLLLILASLDVWRIDRLIGLICSEAWRPRCVQHMKYMWTFGNKHVLNLCVRETHINVVSLKRNH